jgi:lipopolysaccharide/colanic/teichoic acid biosynthesis glycosyltransferase
VASHQQWIWAAVSSEEQATSQATSHVSKKRTLKRCSDFVIAVALLVVLSPLLLVIGLLIRATSPGPAIFRQTRVGRDDRPFVMFKFRTLRHGSDDSLHRQFVTSLLTDRAEASGELGAAGNKTGATSTGLYKLDADPRVTWLGRWLRNTSLDELPQLLNVVRGDMALVGPRPVLPFEAALFTSDERVRFAVRPGMTGLWQVSGRSRIGFREQLVLDARYVNEQSLWLDMRILLLTIPSVLSGGTR